LTRRRRRTMRLRDLGKCKPDPEYVLGDDSDSMPIAIIETLYIAHPDYEIHCAF
jgi:hypothetical protein